MGKDTPNESQPKPPTPPPKLPPPSKLPSPLPKSLPTQTRSSSTLSISDPRLESIDSKRKRPSKGKDLVDEGRSRSPQEEDEARRPSKQLRIGGQSKGKEVIQKSEPQAWLPTAILHEKPLMDDATLRDFRGGEGVSVADALGKSLLLSADMAELGDMKRQEVACNLKRYLGMKLVEAVRAKGVAEYARDEALRAKEEAVFARTDVKRYVEQAKEEAFVEGVAKTEATLKAQVPERAERVYYVPAIREPAPIASKVGSDLRATDGSQASAAKDSASSDKPVEETVHQGALEGAGTDNPKVPQDVVRPPADSQATLVVPQVPPAEGGSSEVAPLNQGPETPIEAPC
nr:uncharacterized protein LOC112025834 [Quercus suber]